METYRNNPSKNHETRYMIMCIGVGGGGSNAVNYMHEQGLKDIHLVIVNTDQQALKEGSTPTKLQIGPNTTHGLGAGANPEIGASAALESREEINKILGKHIKMVFITAGMGGGTGTGAAPIIANIAKEKGMLVIGVITTPFSFEGKKKQQAAEEGIRLLQESCDTTIIIENERLMNESSKANTLSLRAAFEMVDKVLYNAVTSITDPINEPGTINVDFCDIDTMLRSAGNAVIGTGFAEGEGRALKAIQQAVHSPLLRYDSIKGSTRLLLSVASGTESELTLQELANITEYLKTVLENDDIMVIWGQSYEKGLNKQVRVSIIASGFPEFNLQEKRYTYTTPPQATHLTKSKQPMRKYSTQPQHITHPASRGPAKNKLKNLDEKIALWHQNLKNYLQTIEIGENNTLTEKEVKEMLSTPSYKRKNISFSYTPPEQEPPIRHQLNERDKETF